MSERRVGVVVLLSVLLVSSQGARAGERARAAFEAELVNAQFGPEMMNAASDCFATYRSHASGSDDVERTYGSQVSGWAKATVEICRKEATAMLEGARREREDEAARERTRREAAEAQAANDEAVELMKSDSSILVEYVSWRRCESQNHVEVANAAIAREKAKAKIGGVVDRAVLNDAAGVVVDWTKHIKSLDGELKKMRSKPITCNSPKLKRVAACVGEDVPSSIRCRAMQILHADLESPE